MHGTAEQPHSHEMSDCEAALGSCAPGIVCTVSRSMLGMMGGAVTPPPCAVIYFCDSWSLLRALWFGSCATHILWFTYLKALWNTSLTAAGLKKKARFKTTVKTGVNAAVAAEAGDAAPGEPTPLRSAMPLRRKNRVFRI